MKFFTSTLALILTVVLSLSAQRGGSNYNYNNNNYNTGQGQFSSMLSLNSGQNTNGLRPNTNIGNYNNTTGNNFGNNSGEGHGHNNNNNNNTPSCSHGTNCSFGCSHNHYAHTPVCMQAFDAWLHSLSHQSNSAVRMNMASNYVRNNYLTTHQISDILSLFTNQSIMMNIAEEAYPNVCDTYNYPMLYQHFSNSACVLYLQNFVVGG